MNPPVRSLVVLMALSAGWMGASPALAQAAAKPDNATLANTVKQELLHSPDASSLDLRVEARDGVVTLTGLVASDVERISAERIARSTAGVVNVQNRIVVREGGEMPVRDPAGNRSELPRTSPTPATPGAPALPNGAARPGAPGT